jgi:predicted ester cyclase
VGSGASILEDNKTLILRFYEQVINLHDLDAIADLLAPDFVHNGEARGPAGQRRAIEAMFAGMPDMRVATEAAIAEGDLVVVRQVWTGTQTGPFLGIAATKRRISFNSMAMLRVAGGRIAQAWVNEDDLGLMQQLRATGNPQAEP